MYYNFRYYSPTNGKWLSRDKIDELDTVNLYVFAHNNSVCFMDSLGTVSLLSPPAEITECLIRFLYSTAVKNYIGTSVSDATITDFIRGICISEGCLPTSSNFMEHINEYYASSLIVDAINAAKDCISRIPGIGKSVSLTIKTEKIKSPRFWCDKKECSVRYHFKLQTKVYVKIPLLRKTFSWELDTIDITKSAMIPFQVCCQGE